MQMARLLALLAALLMGLTGGTVKVDLAGDVPTVTVCSHGGSYEIPLSGAIQPSSSFELCCGDGQGTDQQLLTAPDIHFSIPAGQPRSPRLVLSTTPRSDPSWRTPPGRAPPVAA